MAERTATTFTPARDAAGRPADDARSRDDAGARLALQRMERSLVRARLAAPDALPEVDYQNLRYAISLARLDRFAPANATRRLSEVRVDPRLVQPFRDWLLAHLYTVLRGPHSPAEKLGYIREAADGVARYATTTRDDLLARHANDFDAAALDREAGRRALVLVAGGGGGAGYVYAGAFACLAEAGLIPDYIVGNSMGAVLGLMRARQRQADMDEQIAFAARLRNRDIFANARQHGDFCLPGLLHLHLRALHRRFSVGDLRRPMRLDELEIPLDVVVAGLRRQPYERWMAGGAGHTLAGSRLLPLRLRVTARLTRMLPFLQHGMVETLVLGRDPTTRSLHAVDAAGFSAAVPSILQYEPGPHAGATRELFAELMYRHELAALVDGGIADNVPARAAWEGVAAGRAAGGTRNAYYLAFDCFLPGADPHHIGLWPVMQAVQRQMRINRVYADTMVRFGRTLSPLNLVPGPGGLARAVNWGREAMAARMAEVQAMCEPAALTPLRRD